MIVSLRGDWGRRRYRSVADLPDNILFLSSDLSRLKFLAASRSASGGSFRPVSPFFI
jgi:hypothetical protein